VSKRAKRRSRTKPSKILVIDIGGTNVKLLATGEVEPRKIPSGKDLTPAKMLQQVAKAAANWDYEGVSIGYPGLVGSDGPHSEPGNLGPGWVGFNFAAALDRPVRIINDAAMQALGSYDGGRMLFLGLGTGIGSALIAENVVIPLELGALRMRRKETLSVQLGREGLAAIGKREWRKRLAQVVETFVTAFNVDYVVLGGGNAGLIKKLPAGARRGHNLSAFRGGFRLWNLPDVPTLFADGDTHARDARSDWRVI
jgi:polyphosphate glucokinase